jgi:uncharacterized SAM-binding protein YcdF (DUF218 family)
MQNIITNIIKILKILLISLGSIFLLLILLSFTSVPFWTQYWLGTKYIPQKGNPEFIIMLGGSGMPSDDNLIRLYYTASLGNKYKTADIIIAHPKDSAVIACMKNELMIRGIDSARINICYEGNNTRGQAMSISAMPGLKESSIVIITSPEQTYRSVLAFRKFGCQKTYGIPTFNSAMYVDLSYNSKKLGGSKMVPDVGNNIKLRYNFWNYLKIEISCLREFTAIGYYKLNGWI